MTLEQLRQRFDNGREYAVGLEDEVMVLDRETLELSYRAVEVLELLRDDPRFKLELPACQLEIVTPPAQTVAEAAAVLLGGRRALVRSADDAFAFAAAGVHPSSAGAGELNRGARYEPIAAEYGWVAA